MELIVDGLTKRFGGVTAVDQVSFTLDRPGLTALIGPNGAGKSTCFNMLGGQADADGGSATLDGERLTGRPPRAVRRLGVGRTFQVTATFPSMTVAENVRTALAATGPGAFRPWGGPDRRWRDAAADLLDRLGIADLADRPCGVLAYGDLKRVELAVALAGSPRLLLMDEPTAGMAPAERARLMEQVRRLADDDRLMVLFTEHDMDTVFANADRLMVMARGRLIADGPPEQVRDDPTVRETYLGNSSSS